VRRLVYGLRPPALDQLGLVPALREQATKLAGSGDGFACPEVSLVAPASLPPLPAAVEVAAYRIVLEALTNVARHAGAHRCAVYLAVNGALELEVVDDGVGLAGAKAGVGLTTMRERAEELGGALVVEPAAGGGTRVLARLPLPGDRR
jgi:signal transduction histidine kinase